MKHHKLHNQIREKVLSKRKVNLRDRFPKPGEVENELSSCKANYDISQYRDKLYIDPFYSVEIPYSNVAWALLKGEWQIDSYTDDYHFEILKITDNKSGQSIEIGFTDKMNQIRFVNEMQTSKPVEQENPGMMFEEIINEKSLYEKRDYKKVTAMAGAAILSFLIHKVIKKFKSKTVELKK